MRSVIPNLVRRKLLRTFHPLTAITLELTNDCNLDCEYCPRKRRPIGYMSMNLFERLIAEIPKYCHLGLSYGGESIMHPQFFEMAELAHAKFKHIAIQSNGTQQYPNYIKTVVSPKPPPIIFTFNQNFTNGVPANLAKKFDYCISPYYQIVILWNGDVTLCCHDVAGCRVLNNILDKSLQEVWDGPAYRKLRAIGYCSGCELYKYYGK